MLRAVVLCLLIGLPRYAHADHETCIVEHGDALSPSQLHVQEDSYLALWSRNSDSARTLAAFDRSWNEIGQRRRLRYEGYLDPQIMAHDQGLTVLLNGDEHIALHILDTYGVPVEEPKTIYEFPSQPWPMSGLRSIADGYYLWLGLGRYSEDRVEQTVLVRLDSYGDVVETAVVLEHAAMLRSALIGETTWFIFGQADPETGQENVMGFALGPETPLADLKAVQVARDLTIVSFVSVGDRALLRTSTAAFPMTEDGSLEQSFPISGDTPVAPMPGGFYTRDKEWVYMFDQEGNSIGQRALPMRNTRSAIAIDGDEFLALSVLADPGKGNDQELVVSKLTTGAPVQLASLEFSDRLATEEPCVHDHGCSAAGGPKSVLIAGLLLVSLLAFRRRRRDDAATC
jgi:MYXO-CTERM domain-containing protein